MQFDFDKMIDRLLIPGKALREAYQEELSRIHCGSLNCLGLAACQAAYEGGGGEALKLGLLF